MEIAFDLNSLRADPARFCVDDSGCSNIDGAVTGIHGRGRYGIVIGATASVTPVRGLALKDPVPNFFLAI